MNDEIFVAKVAGRIARRRRLRTAARVCGAAMLFGLTIVASPFLVAGGDYVARTPLLLDEHLEQRLGSQAFSIGVVAIALLVVVKRRD